MTDHDVVALLLDDAMPPERLGELLRAGRKRRGWKRKQAAAMLRISAGRLRAYERGTEPIPADVCERLAECYGLAEQVPARVALQVSDNALVIGAERADLGDATTDEILGRYAELVGRLRGAKSGEVLALRAGDIAVLAAATDADAETVERRIMDALGCSRGEARELHRALLRRKLVLPVAGLAAGVVALAGVQAAQANSGPARPSAPAPISHETPVRTPAPGHEALPAPAAPQVTVPATPPTTAVPPVAPPAPAPAPVPTPQPHAEVTPPPAPTPTTVATPEHTQATTPMTPPSIPEDDTPVGVLPGETPIHP